MVRHADEPARPAGRRGEWCAATYALCTKGQDEKGRIRFDFHLSLPPPGYHDEWDDEGDDPAAIMQAVQAMTGKR